MLAFIPVYELRRIILGFISFYFCDFSRVHFGKGENILLLAFSCRATS